jgi:DNA-binding MarR family transcriptional regulator
MIRQILQRAEDIYNMLSPGIPVEWFSSDLTVAQLRVLLVLQSTGSSRMSDIALTLDVALSTATGIVDKLVKKELVIREADPHDRRLVICRLSPTGQDIMNRLWSSGQFQMERLLDGLNEEELERAAEVAEMLFNNLVNKKQK